MTGTDLLNLPHPKAILTSLQEHGASDRKIRLFACACCRRIWPLLEDQRSRRAVEFAEQFAEGQVSREELADAERVVKPVAWGAQIAFGSKSQAWRVAKAAEITVRQVVLPPTSLVDGFMERAELSSLFGDIFDAIFRQGAFHRSWLTPEVVRLARAAYQERELPSGHLDRHRLGVLADALEEAGADAELVGHLRDPGPHWRGCHVVDLILGRE